ncbi:hypothetical protein [Pseudoxanthomonas sp. PXM02]|uniref:hypothetical protein n=1 Tax=Pseudoxanthomonas sp. PXM02 TaxID=2769294 RepID=UPI00177F63F1|nr:hypothetical protein [Pseudoxanthomonas sp. PXM02]MBD9481251.1 hypothetical protein [Pseudoxanthomonas sp. PXM02]
MRTLIFIVVGLLLVGIAMWLTRPGKRPAAAAVFSIGWLAAVLWNLRTGMSHGYSLQEELPIQAVIYLVPVAAAWWLAWKTKQR